ncbi:MAG: DUF4384 domain-containing protein [Desulfuromonadaceae bacterium]|nr:DUF4384 domain-containing protein [Desulfuromonadaceae bacterium]MDD2855686.1 DUF4384 domain-containing protein [Desulfuromonadaceae bacterium]
MRNIMLLAFCLCMATTRLYAGQSVITEGQGYSCMGDDKSRKMTESSAFADAKRNAAESASTHIQSETHVVDSVLEKDIISAYSNAQIKVLEELMREWYEEQGLGDCCRVKIKVEVVPDERAMAKSAKKSSETGEMDPSSPLDIKVWTDKKEYLQGDNMKIFFKANKPFYAKIVYKQADGTLLQLLPNPFRDMNYFNGGVMYEIPCGTDRFDLEVSEPFGTETVTVYGSTSPTGVINVTPIAGAGVYSVNSNESELSLATRGVKLSEKETVAEFAEVSTTAVTKPKPSAK